MDWNMMKRLLIAIALLFALQAWAADYYVCECSTLSTTQPHASCAAGSSGNTGTSSSSPKQLVSQLPDSSTWAAGSTLRFCRGGVHKATNFIETFPNATRANPFIIEPYDPPSGATGVPVLVPAAMNAVAALEIGNTGAVGSTDVDGDGVADGQGGITIQGLKFECDGTSGGWGFRVRSPTHSIKVLANEFVGCGIGFRSEQSPSDSRNKFLIFRGNAVHDNPGLAGFNGGCSDCDIEGNTFSGNGAGSSTTHAIYAGCGFTGGTLASCNNMRFRNNTLVDNSIDVNGQCIGGQLTTRGQQTGTVIEGNTIKTTAGTFNGNCIGISHAEGYTGAECMTGTKIRGNVLIGNAGMSLGSTQSPVVENNVLINPVADTVAAALISIGAFKEPDDCGNASATVRNNTIYSASPHANTRGISVNTLGGTGNIICNNLIKYGANPNSTRYMSLDTTAATYTEVCNNLGNGGSGWIATALDTASFEAVGAYNATGQRTGDPVFVGTPSAASPNNAHIQTTSDAKNNAKASRASRLSIYGYVRDASPDIGAFEYGRNP